MTACGFDGVRLVHLLPLTCLFLFMIFKIVFLTALVFSDLSEAPVVIKESGSLLVFGFVIQMIIEHAVRGVT